MMNEKIKELAEQCGMNPIDDMTEFGMGESMNRYNCQGFMLEKFAELIAKEECKNCRDMFINNSVSWRLLNDRLDAFGAE